MSFIPQERLVLYQGSPETKQIAMFEGEDADSFPDDATVRLYARLPGVSTNAFEIICTFEGNILQIPFTTIELASPGSYDYSVFETPTTGDAQLKLQGFVKRGTGIEIVPTIGG